LNNPNTLYLLDTICAPYEKVPLFPHINFTQNKALNLV